MLRIRQKMIWGKRSYLRASVSCVFEEENQSLYELAWRKKVAKVLYASTAKREDRQELGEPSNVAEDTRGRRKNKRMALMLQQW